LLLLTFAYGLTLHAAATYFKFPVVFGRVSRETYLEQRIEPYPAFEWINENTPPDAMVLTLDPRSYYIERPTYQNFMALRGIQSKPFADQLAWLEARGITHLFLPVTYIDESPKFSEWGLKNLFESWRNRPRYFKRLRRFKLPRPYTNETAEVEVYSVSYTN